MQSRKSMRLNRRMKSSTGQLGDGDMTNGDMPHGTVYAFCLSHLISILQLPLQTYCDAHVKVVAPWSDR